MNIELFNKIKNTIAKEPAKLDMRVWKFGATNCIGGLALVLSSEEEKKNLGINDVFGIEGQNAAKLLGITIAQSMKLFPLVGWPANFYQDFYAATDAKERGDVAIARINYFINNQN